MSSITTPVLKLFLSNQNVYGQVVQRGRGVVAAASTLERALKDTFTGRSRTDKKAAADIGTILGSRIKAANLNAVHWERRRGEKYHGKIAALLEAVKGEGIQLS